jgi:hypothetical protein
VAYLERVIDLWDQGGASSWGQGFACAVGALQGLAEVLSVAHVPIPDELVDALALAHGIVNPDSCVTHPSEEP